jgi:hypothetical protein
VAKPKARGSQIAPQVKNRLHRRVGFDGREVVYGFGELDKLVLAYATPACGLSWDRPRTDSRCSFPWRRHLRAFLRRQHNAATYSRSNHRAVGSAVRAASGP